MQDFDARIFQPRDCTIVELIDEDRNLISLRTRSELRILLDYSDWHQKKTIRFRDGKRTTLIPSACDWYITGFNTIRPYAYATIRSNGKVRYALLHRLLTECPKHLVVDHISGATLDNRQFNLRVCTTTENTANRLSRGVYRLGIAH